MQGATWRAHTSLRIRNHKARLPWQQRPPPQGRSLARTSGRGSRSHGHQVVPWRGVPFRMQSHRWARRGLAGEGARCGVELER